MTKFTAIGECQGQEQTVFKDILCLILHAEYKKEEIL